MTDLVLNDYNREDGGLEKKALNLLVGIKIKVQRHKKSEKCHWCP